jgi:hypothetical protein
MSWTFDRHQRLRELIDRQREAESYLLRTRCDTRDHATQALIDRRLAILQTRLRRLYGEARRARRANAV